MIFLVLLDLMNCRDQIYLKKILKILVENVLWFKNILSKKVDKYANMFLEMFKVNRYYNEVSFDES